ncbi:MAG: HAMP domain-containing histidine kinase [Oscillospiraceae bacterium]|nr:HAMP domain-containing histidine kinase [Oscillospiraceae bacterium]
MKQKRPPGQRLYKASRLNLRFLRRILWILLLGDVLLASLLFGWTLRRAEAEAQAVLHKQTILSGEEGAVLASEGAISLIVCTDRPSGGVALPHYLRPLTPMPQAGMVRYMRFSSGWFFPVWPSGGVYTLWLPEPGVKIVCQVGPALNDLRTILYILFGFQLFWFLMSIHKGARSIRRALDPINDMVDRASALSARPSNPNQVDSLAGALHDIDGRRPHHRINEDEAPEELRPLAGAINAMLDRIEAAYASQARFVSDASHELRTPIAVIIGYVNLLDRWGKTDPDVRQESIDALKSEAKGMSDMVEQLLFLARGDSDAIELSPEPMDLGALCEELVRDMRVALPLCEITVQPAAAPVVADRALCRQALRILLDNALKYGEGLPVTVTSGAGMGGWVWASVSDGGVGIAPEDLPYIFDRFYRSDASRAHKAGGTGLGLSIARWIAHRHGGRLTAISRRGLGTKMTLCLPAVRGVL